MSYANITGNKLYYTAGSKTTSTTSYDTLSYDIYYNSYKLQTVYIDIKIGESSDYTAKDFSMSYKSSATSVDFDEGDFDDHYLNSSGTTKNVPDIDYVVITSLPSSKYGILYLGSEKSSNEVDEDDEIEYDELEDLQFVFGSSFVDGKATISYYVVDVDNNKSNTAKITITNTVAAPKVYDYAVATTKGEDYEFEADEFDEAYYDAGGASLSSIKITALPSEGTLYLSKAKVSVGDTITYSKLGNLKYEPDGSNYRDSFSWQGYNGKTYSDTSANMQIIVFKSDITSVPGDLTVYMGEDDDEYSFTNEDFERVYVTDDYDDYPLTTIKITALPGDGTLYLGTEKSSNKVSKNDEIDIDDLDELLYVADSSFDEEDEFEYLVYDGDSYCDKSNYGVVTIKAGVGTGGYTYTQSGTTMTLTFNTQTPSSNTVTGTLTESDITALAKVAKTGTTLIVYIPANDSVLTRSLVIDDILFSVDNVALISKIQLVDGEPDGKDPVIITLDTAAISAQYGHSTADFTLSTTASSPSSTLTGLYSAGKMRTVVMMIGTTNITGFTKVGSAVIDFPCATAAGQTEMAVVLYANSSGANTATPVVSSKFTTSTGRLSADFSALGTGTYLAGINYKSFSDINSSNWEYTYVINLAARSVIDGYPNGTYLNESNIKRSEYIKLLVESFGLTVSGATCQFTDVETNEWYYSYLASAVKSGILSDGTAFNGEAYITRDDMALYSYRAALAAGIDMSGTYSAASFSDQAEIGTAYTAAIQAMQRAGIINGYTDGSFKPKGTTDRGEAAKVIYLLLALYYGN